MEASKELKLIVESNRIPNALIFQGIYGSGKLRAAVEFTKEIFCKSKKNDEIVLLKKSVENFTHPDFHIVFPIPSSEKKAENTPDFYMSDWRDLVLENNYKASMKSWVEKLSTKKQPLIGISAVSNLSRKLSLSSFASGYKVVLFWMSNRLNEESSNKLLKLVEEPGEKTVFIFLTEKNNELLKTLDSRCQKINFNSDLSKGGVFENNKEYESIFSELTRNAFQARSNKESLAKLVSWSNDVSKLEREEIKNFLLYSSELFRQAYLNNIGLSKYVKFKPETGFNFEAFSKYISESNIEQISNVFEESHYHIKRWANNKMVMTNLAFDLTKLIHS